MLTDRKAGDIIRFPCLGDNERGSEFDTCPCRLWCLVRIAWKYAIPETGKFYGCFYVLATHLVNFPRIKGFSKRPVLCRDPSDERCKLIRVYAITLLHGNEDSSDRFITIQWAGPKSRTTIDGLNRMDERMNLRN